MADSRKKYKPNIWIAAADLLTSYGLNSKPRHVSTPIPQEAEYVTLPSVPSNDRLYTTLGVKLLIVAAFLVAYLPDLGEGFAKDDFAWIIHSRLTAFDDVIGLFERSLGFYRPLVALTFGLNELMFGTWSLGFGLTNLALLAACVWLLYSTCRALELTPVAAGIATSTWAFNFHGINMALLWLSGRTALLLTLFSLGAALAQIRNHKWLAAACCLGALLSKEEAVLLPAILATLILVRGRGERWQPIHILGSTWPLFLSLGVYAVLRVNAGALTPDTAPPYYRFTFEPLAVLRNIVEYADRALTAFFLVGLALFGFCGRIGRLSNTQWQVVRIGGLWLVMGFAVTVWLPVRSSLYAVFPSIGSAMILGAFSTACLDRVSNRRKTAMIYTLATVAMLLAPLYWSRNRRWAELGELTTVTINTISSGSAGIPPGALIELQDDLSTRANFRNAFGTLFPEAAMLYFDGQYDLWIEPPPPELNASGVRKPTADVVVRYRLWGGTVTRVD